MKLKSEIFIYYLTVLIMILSSGGNAYVRRFYFMLGITVIMWIYKKRINVYAVATALGILAFIFINSVLFNNAPTDYKELVMYAIRLVFCATAIMIPVDKFRSIFIRIVVSLAVLSLVCFMLVLIFETLPFARFKDGVYGTFYHTIAYGEPEHLVIRKRNSGIFMEPGLFQMYLNAALLCLVHENNLDIRKQKIYFIILSITVISTVSSMGYLVYALVLVLFFLEKENFIVPIKKNSRVGLFFIFVAMILIIELLSGSITSFITNTNSFASRHDDVMLTFLIAKDYPITGIGLATNPIEIWNIYYEKYDKWRLYRSYQNAMSCGIGNFLAMAGIPFSGWYLYIMGKALINWLSAKGIIEKALIMVILVLWVLEEPYLGTPAFMIAFFYQYSKREEKLK